MKILFIIYYSGLFSDLDAVSDLSEVSDLGEVSDVTVSFVVVVVDDGDSAVSFVVVVVVDDDGDGEESFAFCDKYTS
jgi:hypothetical protein